MDLRKILGMKKINEQLTEHERMARRLVRQLTLLGFEAYNVWEIAAEMERLALEAPDYPDLFPPNQRPVTFNPEEFYE